MFDRSLSDYAPAELAERRAVLSQQIAVAFRFRIAEIVAMGRRGATVPAEVIDAALERVELAIFAERIVTTLSRGGQQRAHTTRILIQMTFGKRGDARGLIFLDEPTASLHLPDQLDLAKIVSDCATQGLAIVFILHDLNLMPLLAKRVIALDHGRLVAEGPVEKNLYGDDDAADLQCRQRCRTPPPGRCRLFRPVRRSLDYPARA